jgi:hypothetical protein
MRKKAIYRGIMLAAGLIAVCVILLSAGFSQVKQSKSAEKETVLVQAPSDAIPGSAIKIDEPAVPVLAQIEEKETKQFIPSVSAKEVTKYLKVLLRTLIAPNAP